MGDNIHKRIIGESRKAFPFELHLAADFCPCWRTLQSPAIKGSIIAKLAKFHKYSSIEEFVESFKGKGKIEVLDDHRIILRFSNLEELKICTDFRSLADMDYQLREWAITVISDANSTAERIHARGHIIGTVLGTHKTIPKHPHYH